MDRTKYKNEHTKNNYDRIGLVLPKGYKDKVKEICDELNISVNEYIRILITNDLKHEKSSVKSILRGFSDSDNLTLDKWQIPHKYRDMIEDFYYSKEEGYFVRLKKGYSNKITNDRIINVSKMSELRMIINKSYKK